MTVAMVDNFQEMTHFKIIFPLGTPQLGGLNDLGTIPWKAERRMPDIKLLTRDLTLKRGGIFQSLKLELCAPLSGHQ